MKPKWYISKIEKFSELGFFENDPPQEVSNRIIQDSTNSFFGSILEAEKEKLIDQIITSFDHKRCWFIEDWMIVGSEFENTANFYLDVFQRLSVISNGKFTPKNINISKCGYTESGEERLKIDFYLDNEAVNLIFVHDNGILALSFLQELNLYTNQSNYRFEVIKDLYGACFVYCLSENQTKVLSKNFGWDFYLERNYWLDKANYLKEIESYEQAISCFQKSISTNQSPSCYFDFGSFLIDINRTSYAIDIFKEGLIFIKNQDDEYARKDWWIKIMESEINDLKTKYNKT